MPGLISNRNKIGLIIVFFSLLFFSCEKALDLKDTEPAPGVVFDDLWNLMDQHYALFSVKGVNWDSVYKQTRPLVTDNLTETELFKITSNTLQVLKDGHVTLVSTAETFTYENFYKLYPLNFNWNNIKNNYLKNQYKQTGPVIYKVVDSIGYLYYASFQNIISEVDLNKIFSDLVNTKGLIIDVRNNSGGDLSNAEIFFSRFINKRTLVKYEIRKKGPGHNDFYDKDPTYLSPAGNFYNKPVILLTNRKCYSACNDFVLYMSYLPNVRIIGDQTGGGGAIPVNYILLNGWKLQYSSSITLSPGNVPIENGILPYFNIGISSIDELNGKDPILEKAYQLLQ